MDYATSGPSWLQPPFAEISIRRDTSPFIPQHRAGVKLYTSSNILQSPMFLINSRPSLFLTYVPLDHRYSLSRSYGVNLPSSFNVITPSALVQNTNIPVSVLVRIFT